MKNKYFIYLKKFFCIIFFVVIAFIFIFLFTGIIIQFSNENKLKKDFSSKYDLRNSLIRDIKDGKISKDENNYLILNDKYNGVAKNDIVYSEYCDDNECIVSFLYSSGFPDEAQYIFYSSEDENLIKKYVDESLYSSISLIEEHWYFVQYN